MNELIERLFAVRRQIDEIKKTQLKELEAEKSELEKQIFIQLDELGVDKTSIKGTGTVGINEQIVPQAVDWDKFYDYILEDKVRFMLLNKALNAPSFREALVIEGEIPGLVPFTRRTLSVTKAT